MFLTDVSGTDVIQQISVSESVFENQKLKTNTKTTDLCV